MSHRKVHSQGSVPFSWEAMPGVSKVTNQDCPTDFGDGALNCLSAEEDSEDSPKKLVNNPEIKIPLPPCPILKAPSRSGSTKGFRWHVEADPFLLAYKECTKSTSTLNNNSGKLPGSENNKKGFGAIGCRVRKSRFNMFSCKNSCDVREDNFVKLSQLPALPRDRSRSTR
ncbi:hypothetical protein CerSpe_220280 [Prunus speciosa]